MSGTDIVIGGGGRTGRLICQELAALGGDVKAVVRNPQKYETIFDEVPNKQRIELVKGDVTNMDSLKQYVSGARTVTYAVESSAAAQGQAVEVEGLSRLCDLCKKEKVDRLIVVSVMLSDPVDRFSPFRLVLNNIIQKGIMDNKFKGEEYVRASGQPYTILRPASLTNKVGGYTKLHLRQDSKVPTIFVSRHDLAIVAAAAAYDPKAKNKTIDIANERKQDKNQTGPIDQSYLSEKFGNLKVDSEK